MQSEHRFLDEIALVLRSSSWGDDCWEMPGSDGDAYIQLHASDEFLGAFYIAELYTERKARRRGYANFLLTAVCQSAEKCDIDLYLTIEKLNSFDWQILHRWYGKLGFVSLDEAHDSFCMYRQCQANRQTK